MGRSAPPHRLRGRGVSGGKARGELGRRQVAHRLECGRTSL
jgi:hypothetical protein